jgi:aryl-phospho-beta-D-glucosidase BglC (GH1 family)
MSTSPLARLRALSALTACLCLSALALGASLPLPGTVNTAAYSAFFDIDSGSNNNVAGPDLETCAEGGQDVGWINATEWLEYDVVGAESAILSVTARVASASNSPSMDLLLDGAKVASCTATASGGWQTWKDVTFDLPITLYKDQAAKLRIVFTGSGFNFQKLTLTKTGVPTLLTVSATSAAFEIAGGAKTITVTSDTTWAATSTAAWLTVAPVSGSGNGVLTLTAAANATTFRNATVTLQGGTNTRTIEVTQKGNGLSYLKAVGQDLKDNNGAGNVVQLKGVNVGGHLLQENWMSPLGADDEWTARGILINRFGVEATDALFSQYEDFWIQPSDFDNIKSYGFNMVRIPIYWENVMNRDGTMKANPWTKLDWIVQQCASRDLYVMLDLHGLPGGLNDWQSGGRLANQLWGNSDFQNWTVTLWKSMATHFKGNPVVCGYDLVNEPVSNNPALTEGQFYNRLYQAVRSVDPEHVVIIENGFDTSYGWTNVVFESHHYDFANSGSGSAQMSFAQGELVKIQQWKAAYNCPVFIGEYCFYDYNDVWSTWLSSLNSMGASWSAWTYKVKGAMGNWGLFNTNNNPSPDLNNDSQATIVAKWSKFTTANFSPNPTFQTLIKQYTAKPAPIALPGSFEAENYTSMSGVGTETCSEGGLDVCNISTGDSVTYWVSVQLAGQYKVEYRIAGQSAGGLRLEQAADKLVLGTLPVPATGAWQTWQTISHIVTLQAGEQTLSVVATAPGFNINWIKFTKQPEQALLTVTPDILSFASGTGGQSATVASNVAWTASNSAAWLTVAPISGTGNATLTLTTTANAGSQRTAIVTIVGGGITRSISVNQAAAPQTPPTISPIPNQTIRVNSTTGPLPFTVGSPDTPADHLTLLASSTAPALIPPANIIFGGSGANRTVTVTPAANQTGTATVGVQVSVPSGLSTTTQFTVTVTPAPGSPILDRNGDGISDVWAALYPTAGAPTADPDGDGQNNLAEAQAGTDPTSASSRLEATVERDASGNLVVRWPSIAGKQYYIESSADLHDWTPLAGDYTGTGSALAAIVRAAGTGTDARAFWHVVAFDIDSDVNGLNAWEETHLNMVSAIAASAGANGTITPTGNAYVAKGGSLGFTIAPASGYEISQLMVDAQSIAPSLTYNFSNIQGGHSISVTFKPLGTLSVNPSSLSFTTINNATVAISSTTTWSAVSNQPWLTVTPASGTGNATLAVAASANTGAASRSATITVAGPTGSGLVQTVTVAQVGGQALENIALGKPATASGTESSSYDAPKAVDGNLPTRWSSPASDPQWLMIDLGATYRFSQVVLLWEAAYGKSYSIQISSNKTTWTDIFSTTTGNGATDTIDVNATARYVRMYGTQRGTTYGYSLYEFRIMGSAGDIAPSITAEPAPQTVKKGQTATFTVAATGQGALTYQWYRAEPSSSAFALISAASASTYTTPALVTATDSGARYRMTITDTATGITTTSAAATLTVTDASADVFSIVVLPDIQNMTWSPVDLNLYNEMQYIIDNKTKLNVQFVVSLGDYTAGGYGSTSTTASWQIAKNSSNMIIDAGLPYAVCMGNHDMDAVPTSQTPIPVERFKQYYPTSETVGKPYFGGYYRDMSNGYYLFSAGGLDFIILVLQNHQESPYDPAVAAWANGILNQYSNRRAMISTHMLNPGDEYMTNIISKHDNVFLAVYGHDCGDNGERHWTATTPAGNTVHCVMTDYQCRTNTGGGGVLRWYTFKPAENLIQATTYNTFTDQFETAATSQFSFAYPMSAP